MLLRPFQSEALRRLARPIHLLCVAPTGSGKSLIYERIAAQPGRRTLLITPLAALARQQAQRLEAFGIPVTLLAGAHPKAPAATMTGVWIMSPESLQFQPMLARLKSFRPDFLVVDECHCLYDWGENFRIAFREVPSLIQKLGISRSLWLTATLPPDARRELELAIGEPLQRLGKFSLPANLRLQTRRAPWTDRAEILVEQITTQPEPGIVFVTTREATHRVCRLMLAANRRATAYHAGMGREERCLIEKSLREQTDTVLVATSAFGMGMDYAQFRWSVLWQPPPSLLALAQQIGRIGRNAEAPANALVLWDEEDFRTLQWMTQNSPRRIKEVQRVWSFLEQSGCHSRALEAHFNDDDSIPIPNTP